MRFSSVLLTLAAAASAPSAQSLWTVDPDGSGDFLQIQDAIDAAADGDAIAVAPGAYAPIRIEGKGLRIHADAGNVTVFNEPVGGVDGPAILVADLAPRQEAVLDGIHAFSFLGGSPSVVHVRDCAGAVWLQRSFVDAYGTQALHVESSSSVVLDGCFLQTNLTAPTEFGEPQPGPGARVEGGSRVYAYDTGFRGSHGPLVMTGIPRPAAAQDGGHGLLIVDSEVHLSGGSASGGNGSTFVFGGCKTGGDGGSGAVLVGAGGPAPVLRFTGTGFFGAGGGLSDPCAPPPSPGVAIDAGAGTVIDTQELPRLVAFDRGLLAPGAELGVLAKGQAGDLLIVVAALDAAPALTLGAGLGPLDLHLQPAVLLPLIALPLTAPTLDLALAAPALPPGVAFAAPALQAFVLGENGFPHTAAPLGLTIH